VIVVFDAKCLLCSGWVRFLVRHDHKGTLQFASIQGETGKRLLSEHGLQVTGLQTLLLVDGDKAWLHTAAIFRVLSALGWPWRMVWVGWLVPAFIRDRMYRLVAKNRYRIFGRSDVCMLPPANCDHRFLD
jgi:predicted DCC family thiol-disulfide oxidoreductase YuxK